jgi:hypothetical protein
LEHFQRELLLQAEDDYQRGKDDEQKDWHDKRDDAHRLVVLAALSFLFLHFTFLQEKRISRHPAAFQPPGCEFEQAIR